MAVVGGLLIFIGLAAMVVAVWALARGRLSWANIPTRKAAAGVLAGAFVVTMVGGGLSPQDDDEKVAVQAGASDPASTTIPQPTSTTSTTPEPTTAATAAPATSSPAPPTPTAARVTTTSGPVSTTPTTRATTTTTAKPTTTTTAKPTTTTTAQPPVTGGALAFGTVQCDATGSPDDAHNINEEWVEVVNTGSAVSLSGWTVHDEGPNYTFAFPSGFTLAGGGRVKIHSGSGTDTATDLYWGRSQHVWNNTGVDIAYLVNGTGSVVAQKSCR